MKHPKLMVAILMLVILSSLSFGLSASSWSSSGFDNYNSGSISEYTNAYKVGFTSTSDTFNYTDSLSFGANVEPITYDIDGDGYSELISANNNVLNIYGLSSNTFDLEASKTYTGNILSINCYQYCENLDCSDTSQACTLGTESGFYSITKSSNITTLGVSNSNAPEPTGALNCNVYSNTDFSLNRNYCYYVSDENRLVRFTPQNGSYINASTQHTEIQTTAGGYLKAKPLVADIDNDGTFELIDVSFDGGTDLEFRVYEMSGIAEQTLSLDTSFSTDGLATINVQAGTQEISDAVLIDFESDGNYDICAFNTELGSKFRYGCLDHTGATFLATTLFVDGATYETSKTIVSDMDGDGNPEVNFYIINTGTERLDLKTYEGNTGSAVLLNDFVVNSNSDWGNAKVSGSSFYVNEDNYSDIVLGNLILFGASDGYDTFSNTSGLNNEYNYVFSDFNKDGKHDIIGQKTGGIELFTQGTGIPAPFTPTITLNSAENFSGIYGTNFYPASTCVDTNTTFRALECLFGFESSCTYINTETATSERLNVNCSYQASPLSYTGGGVGDYDGINPSQSCAFTEVGVYAVKVGFQDTLQTGDQISEIIYVNVVSENCNQANQSVPFTGTLPDLPAGDTTGTTADEIEDVDDLLSVFGFGSSVWQILIGLILVIAVMFKMHEGTKSTALSLVAGYVMLIIVSVVGLIGIWLAILIGVVMALFIFVGNVMSPRS